MNINLDMIRVYLLREVAKRNKRLSGLILTQVKAGISDFDEGFNEVLHYFAGGRNSSALNIITQHMQDNPGKNYASYNFFDIDTLIAYNNYLQSIISETDVASYENGHKTATYQDYRKGLSVAQRKLSQKPNSRETGYYNTVDPIRLVYSYKSGSKQLSPMKPMTQEAFNKKYNTYLCQKEVETYLESKLSGKKKTVDYSSVAYEQHEYTYNGTKLKLNVTRKSYYTDANGHGLTSIVASNNVGALYGVYNTDGSVYEGDLYDLEGMLVDVEGGGEIFYPNKTASKLDQPNDKPIETDEQLTFGDF